MHTVGLHIVAQQEFFKSVFLKRKTFKKIEKIKKKLKNLISPKTVQFKMIFVNFGHSGDL